MKRETFMMEMERLKRKLAPAKTLAEGLEILNGDDLIFACSLLREKFNLSDSELYEQGKKLGYFCP